MSEFDHFIYIVYNLIYNITGITDIYFFLYQATKIRFKNQGKTPHTLLRKQTINFLYSRSKTLYNINNKSNAISNGIAYNFT